MPSSSDRLVIVPADDLRAFYDAAFLALGVPPEDRQLVAAGLIDADLTGVDTHGIARFPTYVARVQKGGVVPGAPVTVLRDDGNTLLVDGGDGFGQVAATKAMHLVVERSNRFGFAAAAVRRSSHLGTLAYYARMALPAGAIGFAVSGTSPVIAPWGAAQPLLGSNPWSVAIPARRHPPIVVDISNSVIASLGTRVRTAWAEGIPPGIALDPDGNPTRDPAAAAAGSILPIGGHKGYGLALVLEVLASVLPGAAYSYRVAPTDAHAARRSLGHFLMAIDVRRFAPLDEFLDRVDDLVDHLLAAHHGPHQPGARVPGHRAAECYRERVAHGVPVSSTSRKRALALAASLGIAAPFTE